MSSLAEVCGPSRAHHKVWMPRIQNVLRGSFLLKAEPERVQKALCSLTARGAPAVLNPPRQHFLFLLRFQSLWEQQGLTAPSWTLWSLWNGNGFVVAHKHLTTVYLMACVCVCVCGALFRCSYMCLDCEMVWESISTDNCWSDCTLLLCVLITQNFTYYHSVFLPLAVVFLRLEKLELLHVFTLTLIFHQW